MAFPYVTGGELEEYCRNEIAADSSFFAARALAASRAVNTYCGRSFDTPSGGSATRSYSRSDDDECVVVVHDLADVDDVVVTEDGSPVTAGDVQWEPVNGIDWTGLTVPRIQVRNLRRPWRIDGRRALISVTSAQWGWPSTPQEVIDACLILGKDLAHLRDNRFGVAGYDAEMGLIRIRQNPFISQLLNDLRRPETSRVGSWLLT